MSFQGYLKTIKEKTGKTAEDFRKLAALHLSARALRLSAFGCSPQTLHVPRITMNSGDRCHV